MESSPIDSSSNASSVLSSPASSPPHSDRDHQQITLTVTQLEQLKVEEKVSEIYRILSGAPTHTQTLMLELWRDKHIEFLTRGLNQLGPTYRVLDANRPWLCYWIIHSMALLGESLDTELENDAVDFLSRCEDINGGYGGGPGQDINGGYGGGPGQLPHLATTYAAVNTLVTLGSNSALLSINREALRKFLLQMKDICGAFRMHHTGEMDVRACYTAISSFKLLVLQNSLINQLWRCHQHKDALATTTTIRMLWLINHKDDQMGKPFLVSLKQNVDVCSEEKKSGWQFVVEFLEFIQVASLLNILDFEIAKGVGDYILRCQTYEGGIAGEPGSEAHGGYTFCGLATMILINEVDRLDLTSLIDWVAFRQGLECGFQGRTNKLVDGCYSFWQGGSLFLIQRLFSIAESQIKSSPMSIQQLSMEGNVDSAAFTVPKPDGSQREIHYFENKDAGKGSATGLEFIRTTNGGPLFHSIALQQYILLCSQVLEGGFKDKPGKARDHYHSCYCLSGLSVSQYSFSKGADSPPPPNAVLGPYSNLLEPVHPLYNLVLDKYYKAHEFFSVMS